MSSALAGIRVIDLSRFAPGPYCTMRLADFGAEVIMVEAVPGASAKLDAGAGLMAQTVVADSVAQGAGMTTEVQAALAAASNPLFRGKRSIGLNLKSDAGRRVVYDLIKTADVFVEGFRPGVVDRLGVDYATLSAISPRLVYCSISGFGQTGPYRDRAGHDINYIAVGGALGTIGRPGTAPAIPNNTIGDIAAGGLDAAFAICVALLARAQTGRGQHIDVSMTDGVLSLMAHNFASFFATGQPIGRGTSRSNGGRPFYDTYQCRDGRWLAVGANEPYFYEALVNLMGLPQYGGRQEARESYAEMAKDFATVFASKDLADWMTIFGPHDVCVTPVLDMSEVVEDPHHRTRDMVIELPSPAGPVRQIGVTPKLSDTPGTVRSTSPAFAQDTAAVLGELGYSRKYVAQLKRDGAVA